MVHPDTGEIIQLPVDHQIRTEKAKTANTPWWEPIQIQREHVEILQRAWDWKAYGHLTFKEPIHPEAANKCWRKFVRIVNAQVYGKRYYNRPLDGVLWARATEMQQRNVLHYHFVMARLPEMKDSHFCFWMMGEWSKLAGYARIYPFESGKGGEIYICKYAAKEGDVEYGGPVELMPKG